MLPAEIVTMPMTERPGGGAGQRHAPRSATQMPARVGEDGVRSLCRVADLSLSGARLYTYSPLEVGASILITLPGQKPRAATVRWCQDFVAGCTFDEPLEAATLAELTAIYGEEPVGASNFNRH